MWPIREARLSLSKIADYWSREISPPASQRDLIAELIKAYWRGELQLTGITGRLRLLRSLHEGFRDQIAFAVQDCPEPEQFESLPDGGGQLIRPVRVPIPPGDSSTWSEGDCADAFEALAQEWEWMPDDILERALPGFAGAELAREQFIGWIGPKGFPAPRFWGAMALGAEELNTWMTKYAKAEIAGTGAPPKRDLAITACRAQKQCTYRQALAAWNGLPSSLKRSPRQSDRTSRRP